jgi:hypothetical protein
MPGQLQNFILVVRRQDMFRFVIFILCLNNKDLALESASSYQRRLKRAPLDSSNRAIESLLFDDIEN